MKTQTIHRLLFSSFALFLTLFLQTGCERANEVRARRLSNKAVKAIRAESYHTALTLLKEAVSVYPHDAHTRFLLGRVYQKRNEPTKAIKEYERAVYLDASKAQAHYSLGEIYFKNKDFKKAAIHYEKVVKLRPSKPANVYLYGLYHLGMCLHKNKRYSESAENFEKVLKLKPDFIQGYNGLAVLYYDQAKEQPTPEQSAPYLNKSIDAAKKAITAKVANERTYNLMGLSHQTQKQFSESIAAFKTAKAKNPYSAMAAYNLGATYDLWLEELLTKAKEEKDADKKKQFQDDAAKKRDDAINFFKEFLQLKGGDEGLKMEVRKKISKLNLMKDKELYEKLQKKKRRRRRRRRRRR